MTSTNNIPLPESLLVLGPEGNVYRYSPSLIVDADAKINAAANQGKFQTCKNALGLKCLDILSSEPHGTEREYLFDLSTSPGNVVFSTTLPGLPFDTYFVPQRDPADGKHMLVPSYFGSRENVTLEKRMIWVPQPMKIADDKFSSLQIKFFVHMSMGHSTLPLDNFHPDIQCYLVFRHVESKANYLPPIPNVYPDGKICMGRNFNYHPTGGNILENARLCLNSFIETKMNSDLASGRDSTGQLLFRWDYQTSAALPPADIYEKVLKTKTSNYIYESLE